MAQIDAVETGRAEAVRALHEVLGGENPLSRFHGVRALGRIGARDADTVGRLCALMKEPDSDFRLEAAAALVRLGSGRATGALLETLTTDPEGEVRVQAVLALAEIGGGEVVQPLIDCLVAEGYPHLDFGTDDMECRHSADVQHQVLIALGRLGDERAVEPLIDLLENPDFEDLQETGYRILGQIDSARAGAFLLEQLRGGSRLARRRAARSLADPSARGGSTEVLSGLVLAMADDDSGVRIAAAKAVGAVGGAAAIKPLTIQLRDPEPDVRAEAARTLGATEDPNVAGKLLPLLDGPDATSELRQRVVRILGGLGDPACAETISSLLNDDDGNVAYEAVVAAGLIGVSGPENRLAEILSDSATHPDLRHQAAKSLGRILRQPPVDRGQVAEEQAEDELADVEPAAEPSPIDRLAEAALDPNDAVAFAALEALAEADVDRAERELISFLRGDHRQQHAADRVADQSETGRAGEAPEDAEESAGEPDDAPRPEPEPEPEPEPDEDADASAVPGDPQSSTLASILAATEPVAAPEETAGIAAGSIPKPPRRSPSEPSRVHAARLLGNLPQPGAAAVSALIAAATDDSASVREQALRSLGRIGDESALLVVLGALDSETREEQLAALDALEGLGTPAAAIEPLEAMLAQDDAYMRLRAVENLSRLGGEVPLALVGQVLHDPDLTVCRAALRAIAARGWVAEHMDAVVELMFRFSGELRDDAAVALRDGGGDSAPRRLIDLIGDPAREDYHWSCIDGLAAYFATGPTGAG